MTEGFQGQFQKAISKGGSFYEHQRKGMHQSKAYTENDIVAILGIGHGSAYKIANSELFKTIRISRKSFEDWLKAEGVDDETK